MPASGISNRLGPRFEDPFEVRKGGASFRSFADQAEAAYLKGLLAV
jgi:hypothetical protein